MRLFLRIALEYSQNTKNSYKRYSYRRRGKKKNWNRNNLKKKRGKKAVNSKLLMFQLQFSSLELVIQWSDLTSLPPAWPDLFILTNINLFTPGFYQALSLGSQRPYDFQNWHYGWRGSHILQDMVCRQRGKLLLWLSNFNHHFPSN